MGKHELNSKDPTFLIGANGSCFKVMGKVALTVKMNGLCVPFTFFIADKLTHDIILGHNFLTETRALISYADNSVTFYDNLVELKLMGNKQNLRVCLISNTILPPRSESILNVKVHEKKVILG